jgi:hypothetical protein
MYPMRFKRLPRTIGLRRNTEAYQHFKRQMQALWDFGVMICYAVPTLKKNIKAVEDKIPNYAIPKNDLFVHDSSSPAELRMLASDYKRRLTSYLWLSSFSFFEAFVSGALRELIDFHGGAEAFIRSAEKHAREAVTKTHSRELMKSRARLSGIFAPHKVQRYKKHTQILQQHKYSFPSELLAAYGIRMLVSKAGELKAAEIPALLTQGLHFEFTADMMAQYDRYRRIRNDIAHGKESAHSLKDAFEVRQTLGKLASRIDDHIVANFFVMETFRT